jgi:hypothetical protein
VKEITIVKQQTPQANPDSLFLKIIRRHGTAREMWDEHPNIFYSRSPMESVDRTP